MELYLLMRWKLFWIEHVKNNRYNLGLKSDRKGRLRLQDVGLRRRADLGLAMIEMESDRGLRED